VEDYYRKRALEYERIYHRDDPVRLEEQRKIAEALKTALTGADVLEVAAGTGYWTQSLSEIASTITATDAVEETLAVAKSKTYRCPVEFKTEDAYHLSFADTSFSGGMANFWLSHVPKERLVEFFNEFHRVLKEGAPVFLADNNFDPSSGGKLVRKADDVNTYKLRKLDDGSEHAIVKNYYSREELLRIFSELSPDFTPENLFYGKHFWYAQYLLRKLPAMD